MKGERNLSGLSLFSFACRKNLHPRMQTNFLENMESPCILHGSFWQKIDATCKILQDVISIMEELYKTFMQVFHEGMKI